MVLNLVCYSAEQTKLRRFSMCNIFSPGYHGQRCKGIFFQWAKKIISKRNKEMMAAAYSLSADKKCKICGRGWESHIGLPTPCIPAAFGLHLLTIILTTRGTWWKWHKQSLWTSYYVHTTYVNHFPIKSAMNWEMLQFGENYYPIYA